MLRSVSVASAAALGAIPESEKGQPNGVATLDGSGKVPASELPPLEHDVGKAADEAGMLALAVNAPAMCLRTDFSPVHVFFLTADPATNIANWTDTGPLGGADANPTAKVGTAVVNGVATTYMRSDAAPPLDLGISPSWTAKHTFTGAGGSANPSLSVASAIPCFEMSYTSGGADAKKWNWLADANRIAFRAINDAGNAASEAWGVNRAAAVVTSQQWSTGGIVRLTVSNSDLAAGAGYVPANDLSLATKAYVDAGPRIVAADGKSAQSANINEPALYVVPTSGLYRVSAFVVVSRAATTSSTMPSCSVEYTEATTGVAVADPVTQSATNNLVGLHTGGSVVISAQEGGNIGYVTSNYASSGATSMQYAVHLRIEFLG